MVDGEKKVLVGIHKTERELAAMRVAQRAAMERKRLANSRTPLQRCPACNGTGLTAGQDTPHSERSGS